MKNKTIKLLLPIIFLGFSFATWLAIARSAEPSNDSLSLNQVWTFLADDRILATPILIDDQIIFRTANKIHSISDVNGSSNWEISARASDITINVNYIGKPLVGNSKFLVSEEQENSISVYSTETGEKLWSVDGDINFINAPIELVNDIMAVARHDGNLVVYDLASHVKLWEIELPARTFTPITATPDLVIVGISDALRVYSLKDGNLLNERPYPESLVAEMVLSGSNIFISHAKEGGDWTISSLQLNSLDTNWSVHVGKITHPYLSVTSDRLSLFNKAILLLDTNRGNILWQEDAQKFYSAPAFHGNSLFFISTPIRGMLVKDKYKEICKVKIGEEVMEDCSVVSSAGLSFSRPDLLGPLVTNDLLIVSRDAEVTAFTVP